jgi:predicted RNA-binding protein Jag
MTSDHSTSIVEFVTAVTTAMGLSLTASVTEKPEVLRVNLTGEGAEWLVRRRDGWLRPPLRLRAVSCWLR